MNIREPVYAGQFYPADKDELSELIDKLLFESKTISEKISGKIRGAIVPHAGYVYSASVASPAYVLLKRSRAKKVVLFGPSHQAYFEGAYSFDQNWETPLGLVKVEKAPGIDAIRGDVEHSLEVQVPFLQKIFKQFVLVPLIYGEISAEELAEKIKPLVSKDSVLVASSDLSHYLRYDDANRIDNATIAAIISLDLKKFLLSGDACGKTGIAALMIIAKKFKWKPVLVEYKNSGDTAGDKSKVVGYASIVFVE
ncbi:MAG: AmmeMemoRadiSam system protein B [Candidatus Diapherotrites archaeon]|nr:AmmeMemoRadiSam system protein B [Candidatus Diapherotrites archaeon]